LIGITSELPNALIIRCKKCSCTINCRANDPQTQQSDTARSKPPPQEPVIVSYSCCWSAFRYNPAEVFKGQPSPSNACSERRKIENASNNPNDKENRQNAAILIDASFIAAVRLNREEIKPSPSVTAKISDSIRLAEMIQARLQR